VRVSFAERHLGLSSGQASVVREELGASADGALVGSALPDGLAADLAAFDGLPEPADEAAVLAELAEIAALNHPTRAMIGLGYYGTTMPAVLRRCVLENPAWYTAYTPYQPEISQGRLEALMNYQTLVGDLAGLPVANASLLDEGSAAAEALALAARVARALPPKPGVRPRFAVDNELFPQTMAVLQTRADAFGIDLVVFDPLAESVPENVFGVLIQYLGRTGRVVTTVAERSREAHAAKALVAVAADPLALCLLEAPGALGGDASDRADIVFGSMQRFGLPLGFGGPHAAFFAVHSGLERQLPGRIVGLSQDAAGAPALRLTLQTREQHIRRERATSNICTSQVLLAVLASMYAVWHGPDGLRAIAQGVHHHAMRLADALDRLGVAVRHQEFFDTLCLDVPGQATAVAEAAHRQGVTVWAEDDDAVLVSCDETTDDAALAALLKAVAEATGRQAVDLEAVGEDETRLPAGSARRTPFATHEVFHRYHGEVAMTRYLRRLADEDYALDRGMIPLGSCTMKLNAAVEMTPITWPGFADLHPFAPGEDAAGYRRLIEQTEGWLAAVTGYDRVVVQPNAGSQGELAGLLAIRGYYEARGETERTICLIPSSAHGTNAASAAAAGMTPLTVPCDDLGRVDPTELSAALAENAGKVAALMITYPSTAGVYEATVEKVCDLVHEAGGQVYIDGANLNALAGWAQPGRFGGDVSHLNLHKTFAIPHGGGGPGIGPVAARAHLAPYLPGHPMAPWAIGGAGPVSSAPFGSASVLPISWAYLRLMGRDGLRQATEGAVLAANLVAHRLGKTYPILFTGDDGRVAHECVVDIHPLTAATGITVDDVAKRLVDYGFHAPTMSFPAAGTLMVEPTESEPLEELERFCAAMEAIAAEAHQVAEGVWPADDNPLHNAPHTAECATATAWEHPYSRELAVYPGGVSTAKYWPPVRRVDNAYGDRHLVLRWGELPTAP
jgi:glycine dehydrogenase